MSETIHNCGTCRFWQTGITPDGHDGACHAHPPTPYLTERGWCGEWRSPGREEPCTLVAGFALGRCSCDRTFGTARDMLLSIAIRNALTWCGPDGDSIGGETRTDLQHALRLLGEKP